MGVASLGKYEYPEMPLSDALELARRIAADFGGEITRRGLASSLGMSERGGAFASRLNSLRLWGLATGRGRVRLSPAAVRVLDRTAPAEAEQARRAIAASVPLLNELAARTASGHFGQAELRILLEEMTGASRKAVTSSGPTIERILSDVAPLLRPGLPVSQRPDAARAAGPQEAPGHAAPPASDRGAPAGRPGRIELALPEGVVSLPDLPANVRAMITILEARLGHGPAWLPEASRFEKETVQHGATA